MDKLRLSPHSCHYATRQTVTPEQPEPPREINQPERPPPSVKLFRSAELFGDSRVVCIEHAGAIYRLQITSRGKLILQK